MTGNGREYLNSCPEKLVTEEEAPETTEIFWKRFSMLRGPASPGETCQRGLDPGIRFISDSRAGLKTASGSRSLLNFLVMETSRKLASTAPSCGSTNMGPVPQKNRSTGSWAFSRRTHNEDPRLNRDQRELGSLLSDRWPSPRLSLRHESAERNSCRLRHRGPGL